MTGADFDVHNVPGIFLESSWNLVRLLSFLDMQRDAVFQANRTGSRDAQMQSDRITGRKRCREQGRPRLRPPGPVDVQEPKEELTCVRPVAMMDMDFIPAAREMTLITCTGSAHVLQLSGRAVRVFIGDSVRIVPIRGYRNLIMCTSPSAQKHLRANSLVARYFGDNISLDCAVHGSVILLNQSV